MNLIVASLSLFLCCPSAAEKQLEMPRVIDASNATTPITLDLDWLTVSPGFEDSPFETRALGGSVPGPTIQISPGDTLKIKFRNRLEPQPGSTSSFLTGSTNGFQDPDIANLHFHGPHVSSVLPADDVTLAVPPGEEFEYEVPFSATHMPGTHWVHPHHHGSSTLHLGGGAALALIVNDPPNFLPPHIENAQESVLVFQDWDVPELVKVAQQAGDARFLSGLQSIRSGGNVGQRFVTVNGIYQPTMTMEQNAWYRWRILYAGWQDLNLDLTPTTTNGASCEMHLLAKDGIYLRDYPRSLANDPKLPIAPGGRADVMVKCSGIGSVFFSALSRPNILTVQVVESGTTATASASLEAWAPAEYPEYLQPLDSISTTLGCACSTIMKGNEKGHDGVSRINNQQYQSGNVYMHSSYLGAVVTRQLSGIKDHSYHQHVHPFQLVRKFQETTYFRFGDWHDTILMDTWEVEIKYRPVELAGKVMVHCHNSLHADTGMMAKEYVRDVTSGSCTCDSFGPIGGEGIVDNVDSSLVVGGWPPSLMDGAGGDGQPSSPTYGPDSSPSSPSYGGDGQPSSPTYGPDSSPSSPSYDRDRSDATRDDLLFSSVLLLVSICWLWHGLNP